MIKKLSMLITGVVIVGFCVAASPMVLPQDKAEAGQAKVSIYHPCHGEKGTVNLKGPQKKTGNFRIWWGGATKSWSVKQGYYTAAATMDKCKTSATDGSYFVAKEWWTTTEFDVRP